MTNGERPIPTRAFLSEDKGQKKEQYAQMRQLGFVMLCGLALDLKRNPQSVPRRESVPLNHPRLPVSVPPNLDDFLRPVSLEEKLQIKKNLGAKHIELTENAEHTWGTKVAFIVANPANDGWSEWAIAAQSSQRLGEYSRHFRRLVYAAADSLADPSSFTNKIARKYYELYPGFDKIMAELSLLQVIYEGYLTVYEAGVILANDESCAQKQPLDALFEILQSPAVNSLTQNTRLNAMVRLGTLGFYPKHMLERDRRGQITDITEDMKIYMREVNAVAPSQPPHPLSCPFTVPLHSDGVSQAIAKFGGEENLPPEVVAFMKKEADTPGISLAGKIMAEIL